MTLKIGLAGIAFAAALFCQPAHANVVYTYTGQPFDVTAGGNPPAGSYTSAMSVTGSFTLATPLAQNLFAFSLEPSLLSFSFTDGRSTISSGGTTTIQDFTVTTDFHGNIVAWSIDVLSSAQLPGVVGSQLAEIKMFSFFAGFDEGQITQCTNVRRSQCTDSRQDTAFSAGAGTWSAQTATAVPAPLVGAGLPGLLAGFGAMLAWRRKRRASV